MLHKILLLLWFLVFAFSAPVTSLNVKQVLGGSTRFRTHLSSNSSDFHLKSRRQDFQVPDGAIILDKETCSGREGEMTRLALEKTAELARMAAIAASEGSAERFFEYFGTNSSVARYNVKARFESFAAYAQVAFEGKRGAVKRPIIWYCEEDPFLKVSGLRSSCAVGGVEKATAYALFYDGVIVNCLTYYRLPSQTKLCPGGLIVPHTREISSLHELTHLTAVFSKPPKSCPTCIPWRSARDHAYLVDRMNGKWQKMTSEQRLSNADSYAYFAHSVALECPRMPHLAL